MKIAFTFVTTVFSVAVLVPLSVAQDASCSRFIELTAQKPKKPYRAVNTIKMDGTSMRNEAIYIDGVIYSRPGDSKTGKWAATPLPDLTETIAMAKKTTSKCSLGATEMLDGKPMQVWTSYATTPFDTKPSMWKTWIGLDGLVYRQVSDGFEQRFSYDNVSAPPAQDVAQPRKRK